MDERMTKERLLDLVQSRRAEWDALVALVPRERMTEPGVAGHWSVKDIIAHLTYYERWFADRLHEELVGQRYTPNELDMMGDARNDIVYEQTRDQPLEMVLDESRAAFERLIAGITAHSEAFLTEPQQFEGPPQPMIIWQMLAGDVYDHYPQHIPSVRAWLAR